MANLNLTEAERQRALGETTLQLERQRHAWPEGPWTIEDQAAAFAEGWALSIFTNVRNDYGKILNAMDGRLDRFNGSSEKAAAFVKLRAEQGSDLHQRALVLHIAALLGHYA